MTPERVAEIRLQAYGDYHHDHSALVVIKELCDEVERLQGLLLGEPKLISLSFTQEDGLEVNVEHWAVKLIASSLMDTLLNGREPKDANYVTMTIQSEIGPLEVTIRKVIGTKTPADTINELKQEIEILKDQICRRQRLETYGSF